ncbi:MAG: metal-dependent transcriptional regulator [Oscillospiraceae bacterium]|nr:metal-dependent transcriptional regulator [Oscillospiraceae bacterium]
MHLHQSGEDYLEAILELRQEKGLVRSIDVAQKLGFSKPSVSRAMAILRADGYIEMERSGAITLTENGERVARTMLERHHLLTDWLTGLGVSPWVAANDACRMEHALSEETFNCLKKHMGLEVETRSNEEE